MTDKPELPDDLAEAFEYLDDLRESGATNMYGAGDYLIRDMGYDRETSSAVLTAWMKTFDNDKPADDRAFAALEQATRHD